VTANHVVRRLIQRAGAADETASDPGAGRRAGQRRRAPGLALGKQLDAVLAAADDELLTYIRASTDPEAGLAALMADNGKPDPGAARPMSGYRPNSRVGLSRVRRRQGCVSAESRRYTRWVAVSVAAVFAAAGGLVPAGGRGSRGCLVHGAAVDEYRGGASLVAEGSCPAVARWKGCPELGASAPT
jgi:hypothetical protein